MNKFRGFRRLTPPCFVLRRAAAGLSPALWRPPQTGTCRPPAVSSRMPKCLIARAASMSRSCSVLQLGHLHSPTDNGISATHPSSGSTSIKMRTGSGLNLLSIKMLRVSSAKLGGDLSEPPINAEQDFAAIFGAPDHLVLARKGNDVAIRSVVHTGAYTMRHIASHKGAHSSPMPEGRGLRTFR
jgi:hypothetical protein